MRERTTVNENQIGTRITADFTDFYLLFIRGNPGLFRVIRVPIKFHFPVSFSKEALGI